MNIKELEKIKKENEKIQKEINKLEDSQKIYGIVGGVPDATKSKIS